MVSYSNGYIPDSSLVTFNVGYSPGEGYWKHQLSPGTYAKHVALVNLARRNTGRTLALSAGWSGYRPYSAQVYARGRYGNGAATPGTSSHGGFWERQQTMAIDYGNWSYVYNGDRAAFYRDVRAVGLEPGLISPQRGYPDEPWHVVDKQPWAAGAATSAGGSTSVPAKPEPEPVWEDDNMRIFKSKNGTFYFARAGFKLQAIRGTADLRLLRRFLNSRSEIDDKGNGKDTEMLFNEVEVNIIDKYMQGIES